MKEVTSFCGAVPFGCPCIFIKITPETGQVSGKIGNADRGGEWPYIEVFPMSTVPGLSPREASRVTDCLENWDREAELSSFGGGVVVPIPESVRQVLVLARVYLRGIPFAPSGRWRLHRQTGGLAVEFRQLLISLGWEIQTDPFRLRHSFRECVDHGCAPEEHIYGAASYPDGGQIEFS